MSKAIYAFSGDPITFGHIDIITRAARIFDEVIVAIGVNPNKKYLFKTDERVAMASRSVGHLKNVTVTSFQGLLVDFAYENDVLVIIRGLRNTEDFNFELMFHQVGETQIRGIETFLIPCNQQLAHVSSGAVKALQAEQGLIHEYVPLNVKQKLEQRISGQLVIGVTGEIGSGKSYLINSLLKIAHENEIDAMSVDLDKLAHEILEHSVEPVYHNFRKQVITKFGCEVELPGGFINSKKLGTIIFSEPVLLKEFNQMIYAPLMLRFRKAIYGKRGLMLLESALLAETDSLFYSNNHIVFTHCNKDVQCQRLKNRGYTDEKINCLLKAQFSSEQKYRCIEEKVKRDNFGKIIACNNAETEAKEIFGTLSSLLPAITTV